MMKDQESKEMRDLMAMNVTWFPGDLEVYSNQIIGTVEATTLTACKIIILAMGVITQRIFFRMMKRLPGRPINQLLLPHMVSMALFAQIILFIREQKYVLLFRN